jgi:AcrR family transcriptional regulator
VAVDPRPGRRAERTAEILGVAWELARELGLAGISLHELARRVGMRQPSLYSYFPSKAGLYDAMFRQANEQLLDQVAGADYPAEPRLALKASVTRLMAWALADIPRSQLIFDRTIPGFTPTAESYALARRFLDWHRTLLEAAGIRADADADVFVALTAGLMATQIANDPGGDRWSRHSDWVVDMFLDHLERHPSR